MAKIKSYIHVWLFLCAGLVVSSCTKWNYHDGDVAAGVHDCSMWDYFKKQPRDWDSTRLMIQRAGLQDLFEGKGEYGQMTFLAPNNLVIMTKRSIKFRWRTAGACWKNSSSRGGL